MAPLPNNLALNLHWYLFTKGEDTIDGYCVVGYFGLPLDLSSGASTNTQTRPSFASCSISLSSMKLSYSFITLSPLCYFHQRSASFMVILRDWVEGSWQLQLTTFHFKVTPTKTLKRLWPLKPSKAISPLHTNISSGWTQIRQHLGRNWFQFLSLIL